MKNRFGSVGSYIQATIHESERALVLVVVVMSGLLAIGSLTVLQSRLTVWRSEAMIDGLRLRIVGPGPSGPVWLDDQMLHGSTVPMPASMTPDLPERGSHRLSVEIQISNLSDGSLEFSVYEMRLRSVLGPEWTTGSPDVASILAPGQNIYLFAYFDVPEVEREEIALHWVRGGRHQRMMVVGHPPDHEYDDNDGEPVRWPADLGQLPPGGSERGKLLYSAKCWGCHGHPKTPGSNTLGPHLGSIGKIGAERIPGMSAAAYVYQSLLEPDASIAPLCKGGPCASPSQMPSYRAVVSPRQIADIIAYLMQQK